MRHGTSNNTTRRPRNRNHGGGGSNNGGRRNNNQPRTQVYDSNGPDVRIRGTAHQVAEKYMALAKDATSMGNRVMAESYHQHAEHYIRIINEFNGGFNSSKDAASSTPEVKVDENSNIGNQQKAKSVEKVEDLGLPASILGGAEVKNKTEAPATETTE